MFLPAPGASFTLETTYLDGCRCRFARRRSRHRVGRVQIHRDVLLGGYVSKGGRGEKNQQPTANRTSRLEEKTRRVGFSTHQQQGQHTSRRAAAARRREHEAANISG